MTYSPLDLKGKLAVVIGGTSGIGRAIAHGLAQAGADVIPTSRRTEQVEVAAGEIEGLGRRTLHGPHPTGPTALLCNTFWKKP